MPTRPPAHVLRMQQIHERAFLPVGVTLPELGELLEAGILDSEEQTETLIRRYLLTPEQAQALAAAEVIRDGVALQGATIDDLLCARLTNQELTRRIFHSWNEALGRVCFSYTGRLGYPYP